MGTYRVGAAPRINERVEFLRVIDVKRTADHQQKPDIRLQCLDGNKSVPFYSLPPLMIIRRSS